MKDPDEGFAGSGIGGESFEESSRGGHVGFGDGHLLFMGAAGQGPDSEAKDNQRLDP